MSVGRIQKSGKIDTLKDIEPKHKDEKLIRLVAIAEEQSFPKNDEEDIYRIGAVTYIPTPSTALTTKGNP